MGHFYIAAILRYTNKPQEIETKNSKMAPMPYPYTFGAKLKAFPWKFHYNNCWLVKAWCIGFALTLPIMYKIQMGTGYGLYGEGPAAQKLFNNRKQQQPNIIRIDRMI